jgi:two-component system chemotaxis response regulator CheY
MKALVVDDDVVSRMALVDLMEGFDDLEVIEATDGSQAWGLLQGGLTPVILCSDVQMPGMTGIELLQQVRSDLAFKEMPFVLVTSSSDLETVRQAISLGSSHYIVKPFNPDEARENVEKILVKVRERVAENPALTLRRLSLPPERLGVYLASFQKQIAAAVSELVAAAVAGNAQGFKTRVDALHTGCTTLGLWFGANLVHRLREGRPSGAFVEQVLADVQQAVAAQAARLSGSNGR